MADAINVYSPDFDNEGNPKPSILDLKDAIEDALLDAENFAQQSQVARSDALAARDFSVSMRDEARTARDDAEQTAIDIGKLGGVDDTVQATADLPVSDAGDQVFYVLDDVQYYQDTGSGPVAGGWEKVGPNISLDATQIGHVVSVPENANSRVFVIANFESVEDAIQSAVDHANNNGGGPVPISEAAVPFDESLITVPDGVSLTRPERPSTHDVEELVDLRDLSTGAGSAAHVRAPENQAGVFVPMASDPFGNGDDGAVALQTAEGNWWVRQKAFDQTRKIEWYGADETATASENAFAIQDAIDAAEAVNAQVTSDTGKTYVVDSRIDAPGDADLIIPSTIKKRTEHQSGCCGPRSKFKRIEKSRFNSKRPKIYTSRRCSRSTIRRAS